MADVFSADFADLLLDGVEPTGVELGRGSFGTVFEVKWGGKVAAAKKFHFFFESDSDLSAEKRLKEFTEECRTWAKLQHPNMVTLLGIYRDHCHSTPVIHIVMEKMDASLGDYLIKTARSTFPLHKKVCVLLQVALALSYLHGQTPPLVHHDLKPDNIMINISTFEAKLTDFGMIRTISHTHRTRMSSVKGTPVFMSPEAMTFPPRYDEKLDVFSYGCVIISVLSHSKAPVPTGPTAMVNGRLVAVSDFDRRKRSLETFTAVEKRVFLHIVERCLEFKPAERPSSAELVQGMALIVAQPVIIQFDTEESQAVNAGLNATLVDTKQLLTVSLAEKEALSMQCQCLREELAEASSMKEVDDLHALQEDCWQASDLPKGWSATFVPSGRVVYANHVEKKTQWTHPTTGKPSTVPARQRAFPRQLSEPARQTREPGISRAFPHHSLPTRLLDYPPPPTQPGNAPPPYTPGDYGRAPQPQQHQGAGFDPGYPINPYFPLTSKPKAGKEGGAPPLPHGYVMKHVPADNRESYIKESHVFSDVSTQDTLPRVPEPQLTSSLEEQSISSPKTEVSSQHSGGRSDPPEREDKADIQKSQLVSYPEIGNYSPKELNFSSAKTEASGQQTRSETDRTEEECISDIQNDEAALKKLCWAPFDIKTVPIEAKGGILCLQTPGEEMGGSKEDAIFVEVPPDAVSASDNVEMHYAIIADGPFTLPEGYQLGSMAVYIYYDGQRVTKRLKLHLPHWYGGEDHVRDGLSFATAPHSLKKGKGEYQFELLEGGVFTNGSRFGVIEIGGHCSLFAKVFRIGATPNCQAFCLEKEERHETLCDIAVTYASLFWIQILQEFRHGWKVTKSALFQFKSDRITATLKEKCHNDWNAVIKGPSALLSSQVHYECLNISSTKRLEKAVKNCSYPPAITCAVTYREELRRTGRCTWVGLHISGIDPEMEFQCRAYEQGQATSPTQTIESGADNSLSTYTAHIGTTSSSHDPLNLRPSLKDLEEKAVLPVAYKWFVFGLQLDIQPEALNAIRTPNGSNKEHCLEMFRCWLAKEQGCGSLPRTWSSVLRAVENSCGSEVRQELSELIHESACSTMP